MKDRLEFRIALVLARWVPVPVRNLLVWLQARRDGKFGWYSRYDVVLRWMGRRIAWDPELNPVHARIEDLLKPNPDAEKHDRERQAVEKELAQRASFWVLVTLFLLLFLGDLFGSIQLFKTLGYDGFRRLLMSFALSSVLFALPLLAVRFYTKKTKHWFFLVTGVLLLVITAISLLQLEETTQTEGALLAGVSAGLLLSLGVIGPAILAKFVLTALLPVWQLRKERRRLKQEIRRAKREERMAERYVRDYHQYSEWYGSHAAQIASVYRRAFARKYLAVHKDPQGLQQMLDGDSLRQLDEATRRPEGITAAPANEEAKVEAEEPDEPRDDTHELKSSQKKTPRKRKTSQLKALDGGKRQNRPEPDNPYQRLQ